MNLEEEPNSGRKSYGLIMCARSKRALKILAYIMAIIGFILIAGHGVHFDTGHVDCIKCFATKSWTRLDFFGIQIYDGKKNVHRGTPELRAVQRTCSHWGDVFYQNGSLFGWIGLSGDLQIGCSPGSMTFGNTVASISERAGGMEFVVELAHDLAPEQMDEWTWFMQQASGHDFGAYLKDNDGLPTLVVPDDTMDRVLDWWKNEGREKYAVHKN
jgi:hypothetical protein